MARLEKEKTVSFNGLINCVKLAVLLVGRRKTEVEWEIRDRTIIFFALWRHTLHLFFKPMGKVGKKSSLNVEQYYQYWEVRYCDITDIDIKVVKLGIFTTKQRKGENKKRFYIVFRIIYSHINARKIQ